MAITAQFPLQNRRIIRDIPDPLDKSTIVSIYPRQIIETKPTVIPGRWVIPAGTYDKPAVFHVGPSSWFRDLDENSPILQIPHSSIQMAESIVKDYCVGILECNMGDRVPGLFFLRGVLTSEEVKKDHKAELDAALAKQKEWFLRLTIVGDSLWARANGNPIAISDDMRLAARELGLQDKAWLKDYQAAQLVKCVACGNLRDTNYPICPSCKFIDPSHPRAKDLTFAK